MTRAVDVHVHPATPGWLDGSMRPFTPSAERHFRRTLDRRSLDELADDYRALDVRAVLLAWDAETATGLPRLPNEEIARACVDHPDVFSGFGSVDPLKGERAVAELDGFREMGLRGVKLHPSLQEFAPDDERHWPLFERCAELGLVCLVHTGTSAVGAGTRGGGGIRLDWSRPIRLDPVAAAFPSLDVVAAHFGWPWHAELLAIALHKRNVWIDISGWAPRYIPQEVLADLRGRLQDQFLFGSDYPFIPPERCLRELDELGLEPAVLEKLLRGNAERLLDL